jgi:parallel beta-helix repeat protein
MVSARVRAVLVVMLIAVGPAGAAFTSVDRSIRVDQSGTACLGARFTRIQDALDAAKRNASIVVCSGVYDEQIRITKPVRLQGTRGAVVRPTNMVANTTSPRTNRPVAAVAVVSAKARISGLDFDASANGLTGCGEDTPLLIGVYFRGAGGRFERNRVHGVRLGDGDRGCDNGAAVVLQSTGGRLRATVSDNLIFDYQRSGLVANEAGTRVLVRRNTVTGDGPTPDQAQNGIQVGFGATARIVRNVVQNNHTPSTGCVFDGGNLFFQANGGLISRNTFTGNTAGVLVTGSNNRIRGNTVDGLTAGAAAGLDGISVFGDRNLVTRNTVRNNSEAGIRVEGDGNRVLRNAVTGSHGAALCAGLRTEAGCTSVIDQCGMGIWVAGGRGNRVGRNKLGQNDIPVRDQGAATFLHADLEL